MKQKWEFERAEREAEKLEREAERKRLEEKEAAEKLEREAKEAAEKLEREAERSRLAEKEQLDRDYERQMMELRRAELEDRRTREAKEEAERNSKTAKAKRFGDAMRNSTFRMGNDPIDLIALFEHVEEQFRIYGVPDDMKVQLMRPFLNDKASALLTRFDTSKSNDYKLVKEYLTHQFELSPRLYLSRFNNSTRRSDETCISFCSRLKVLLQYYLTSRNVSKFEELFSLIVSDRVKGVLPEDVLRYVLSVEASKPNGWLDFNELATVVDNYQANFIKGKPIAAAIGFSKPSFVQNSFRTKEVTNVDTNPTRDSAKSSVATENKTIKENSSDRNCFVCGSKKHLARQCPNRRQSKESSNVSFKAASGPVAQPRVHRVQVEAPAGETMLKSNLCAASPNCSVDESTQAESAQTTVCDVTAQSNNSSDCSIMKAHVVNADTEIDSEQQTRREEALSPLNYVDIRIAEVPSPNSFSALVDSGSEICVVHQRLLGAYEYIVCGQVKLRGIVGNPIAAKLTYLTIQLAENPQCEVKALCAVSDQVNENLLVTRTLIDQLHKCYNSRLLDEQEIQCNNESLDRTLSQSVACQPCDGNINILGDSDVFDSSASDRNADSVTNVQIMSNEVTNSAQEFLDVDHTDNSVNSDLGQASVEALRQEQLADETLTGCWALAQRNKGCYHIRDGLLFRCEKVFGQTYENLVVPKDRRPHVLRLAHDLCGGHMAMKKTRDRIRLSGLTWPTLTASCKSYCSSCEICQKRARVTCYDSVPITAIPRATEVFSHWFSDVLGPLNIHENMEYNYCLVMIDSASRWPACFPLRSVTAKNICLAMLNLFQYTSMGTNVTLVSSDNASYFKAALTREFMNRIGVSPRFHVPGYPSSTGLVERAIGSIKSLVAKVAAEHPKKWTAYLPFIMWALREAPNETTGVPPYLIVYNRLPRGPLAILKESWLGNRDLPVSLGKKAEDFLRELKENLEAAHAYVDEHTRAAQHKYVHYHNLRTRSKKFVVGEKCLILQPDSTASRVFSKWRGPAEIVEIKSPDSYIVELDGKRMHIHANYLRHFNVRVDQLTCNRTQLLHLFDVQLTCNDCAIIYEDDVDFGDVNFVEPSLFEADQGQLLPSQVIDRSMLAHLKTDRQQQLLNLLDEYAACFSETPGLCTLVMHTIPTTPEFVPKRLRAYRVPENLKAEVDRQIAELLRLGFITESNSPMASPVVAVLKRSSGSSGSVRLCVNFQYLNRYTLPDQIPLPNISEVVQKIGKARFISSFDATSGYYQCLVAPEDRWKTSFVCDNSQYLWIRCPFGLKSSGCTFIRMLKKVLDPIKNIAESYVDDIAVYSGDVTKVNNEEKEDWKRHLADLRLFFQKILESGLTLNLKKSQFAKSEVKFVGHVVGSGWRRADSEKVDTIKSLRVPETKRQVKQILGLFSYFREYIQDFAKIAKPLTDLTSKRVPEHFPWGSAEQEAFEKLKELLIEATINPLHVIDCSKPFTILVDACDYAVGGILVQPACDNTEQPVAFASCKLTPTQRRWPTIQKEGYGIVWALKKFKHWIFLGQITVVTDHCPLTYT